MIYKGQNEQNMSKADFLVVSRALGVVFPIIGNGERLIKELKKNSGVIQPEIAGKHIEQAEKIISSYKDSPEPIVINYSDFKGMFFLLNAARARKGSIIVIKN
jgi:hypothetical protein